MNISELRVIHSPHYEGTNNLIKRQFRHGLSGVGARTHAIKLVLAGYLRMEALISTIVGLLILCSKNVLGL